MNTTGVVARSVITPVTTAIFTKRTDVLPQDLVKPWDSDLDFFNRSESWQAPRQQQCRRDACQTLERYDHHNTLSRWLRNFTRFGGKTFHHLLNRRAGLHLRTVFLLSQDNHICQNALKLFSEVYRGCSPKSHLTAGLCASMSQEAKKPQNVRSIRNVVGACPVFDLVTWNKTEVGMIRSKLWFV